MNNRVALFELINQCNICADDITGICLRDSPSNIPKDILEDLNIESLGFILAFLHFSNGISTHEAGECIACFVGIRYGNNIERYNQATHAAEFYSKIFYKYKDGKEDLIKYSILIHNLRNPKKWDDFEDGLPLLSLDLFDITEVTKRIGDYLLNRFPEKINPILKKY